VVFMQLTMKGILFISITGFMGLINHLIWIFLRYLILFAKFQRRNQEKNTIHLGDFQAINMRVNEIWQTEFSSLKSYHHSFQETKSSKSI